MLARTLCALIAAVVISACNSDDASNSPENTPLADDTTTDVPVNSEQAENDNADGDNAESTSAISSWGVIEINSLSVANTLEIDIEAIFLELENSPATNPQADVQPGEPSDLFSALFFTQEEGCRVTVGAQLLPGVEGNQFVPDMLKNLRQISAGDVVTLSDATGILASLQKNDINGVPSYELNKAEATPITTVPEGLLLDIPGDQFPALTSIAVPDAMPINIGVSTGSAVTAETRFDWITSGLADAMIEIFSVDRASGTMLQCAVNDDGSFDLPAEVKTQLPEAFAGNSNEFSRAIFRVHQLDGSELLLVNRAGSVIF